MLSKLSIRRPITTIMFTLMAFIAGIAAYSSLNLSLMPNMDVPIAVVSTTYVGAGSEEIENLISKPLEEALGTVSNVETIRSTSKADHSMVMIQFADGTDIDMVSIDVREVIDRTKSSLPEDAGEPSIIKMDMNAKPIHIGATSDTLTLNEMNALLEDSVLSRFERMQGVASVQLSGGIEKEIRLTIDPNLLAIYGLTPSSLSQILKAENMNLPAGSLTQGDTSIKLRTLGQFSSIEEIRNLPIATPTGAIIQLDDIASVEEVEIDRSTATYINHTPGVLISIDKQSTANLVTVSETLQEQLDALTIDFPEINFSMLSDTSEYIQKSISNVTTTAFLSAVIAFFVILIFLKNPVTSGIIATSIPTSILITFVLMYFADMSLNTISMGGIAIGIGMLVDNSIVVLDSIYQYYEKGSSPTEAAELGAKEVTMSIIASTLTTVAVFLPIAFIEGSVGQLLQNLSFSVTFALLASLVVSITFVPMACALLLQKDQTKKKRKYFLLGIFSRIWDSLLNCLTQGYNNLISWSLKHRKISILVILILFIASLTTIPMTGMDFMEETDEGVAEISISLPHGTDFNTTEELTLEVLYRLQSIPEAETTYADISSSSASVTMNLLPKDERIRNTNEVTKEINSLLEDIAGAEINASSSSSAMGSMGGSSIAFSIYGYDNNVLMNIEKDIISLLESIEGFEDVEGSTGETIPEAKIEINRNKAAAYGITTASISSALNPAITGSTATQYKVNGTELDMVVRYEDSDLEYLTDLENLILTTATGAQVPLGDVADISIVESSTSILRENQQNSINITANSPNISGNVAQDILIETLDNYSFPAGCSYGFSGSLEMMTDSFNSLIVCTLVGILLVYMIMAAQFESLRSPFIVMFSMPLAITGGVLGLFITGKTITMPAMMGFVMLVGMVVNNAIVLVDYTNQLMEGGLDCTEALITAGTRRLRPILMTTLTTVLGMVPMAIAQQEGSEMMQGLAIAVIFGLVFSTLITLVLIPILYAWMHDKSQRRKIKKMKKLAKRTLNIEKQELKLKEKSTKKELKQKEKTGKKELKEKEKTTKKELKEKEKTAKKELKEKEKENSIKSDQ